MMKFFRSSILSALLVTAASGMAAAIPFEGGFDLWNHRWHPESGAAFRTQRDVRIDRLSARLAPDAVLKHAPANEFTPDFTLGPANMTGDIDAPNGERWFYTANYDYDMIPGDHDAGIYYDTYILRNYCFHIYDPECRLIGTIDAPMEYTEDESKVVSIELAPVATRHFFNTDDNVEVMVSLAINTKTPGYNHYRSLIYSFPAGASDVLASTVGTVDLLLANVVEGPARADGRDNFHMVFSEDVYPEDVMDDDEEISFWDYVTAARMDFSFYAPADNDTDGPVKEGQKSLPLLNLPGDQESTPFMMSYVRDGKIIYFYSYLEEPVWEEYDDPIYADLVQRDCNKLNVEFYEATGTELKLIHKTSIDVVRDEADQMAVASFYGVGDMNYYGDLLYDAPGASDGKPWMVVTRSNYNPSSDNSNTSYFVYDSEGVRHHVLAQYCDSSIGLSDIPGMEPQQLFISFEGGQYLFQFVDIYSGKERLAMTNYYETPTDYEAIMANVDRTPVGAGYRYAFEMSAPSEDREGNTLVRVLWIDENGKFDRIDNINAGKDVMYAKLYIEGTALQPDAFCADPEHEYLCLVKRGLPGDVASEELLLSQPVSDKMPLGKDLLFLKADERGALSTIVPMLGVENPNLTIYYHNSGSTAEETFTQDVYYLPLGEAGANGVNTVGDGLSIDGHLLTADGKICVFSLDGTKVTESEDSLNLEYLPKGMYVVVTAGRTLKVMVN